MPAYQLVDSANLGRRKSTTPVQPNRAQPELCDFIFALDMNMRGLIAVAGIKEETVGTDPQYCWHPASQPQHLNTPGVALVYTAFEPKIKAVNEYRAWATDKAGRSGPVKFETPSLIQIDRVDEALARRRRSS